MTTFWPVSDGLKFAKGPGGIDCSSGRGLHEVSKVFFDNPVNQPHVHPGGVTRTCPLEVGVCRRADRVANKANRDLL